MIENNRISDYYDLEEHLLLFSDNENFTLNFLNDHIEISIKHISSKLKITDTQLNNLINGRRVNSNIEYYGSSGFSFDKFTEVCLSVYHPRFTFLDSPSEWRTDPVLFFVGSTLFEISLASPLFKLLFEPVYIDSDFQYEFENFATLKLIVTNGNHPIDEFQKGLFYLNSSILKKIGFVAQVKKLDNDFQNLDELFVDDEEEISDVFHKLKSDKAIRKPELKSIEPLSFYNQALLSSKNIKFLYLYRVLEFFMTRSRIEKLKELRNDSDYTELQILKFIEAKNEEKMLINLVNESLDPQVKVSLIEFAFENNLIGEKDINKLGKLLYKFRNSIVHGKETHIFDSEIPNQFETNEDIENWIFICDKIAIKAINKYNKMY